MKNSNQDTIQLKDLFTSNYGRFHLSNKNDDGLVSLNKEIDIHYHRHKQYTYIARVDIRYMVDFFMNEFNMKSLYYSFKNADYIYINTNKNSLLGDETLNAIYEKEPMDFTYLNRYHEISLTKLFKSFNIDFTLEHNIPDFMIHELNDKDFHLEPDDESSSSE